MKYLVLQPIQSSGNRLIIAVAAGTKTGCVNNSLLIFKALQVTGYYHGEFKEFCNVGQK